MNGSGIVEFRTSGSTGGAKTIVKQVAQLEADVEMLAGAFSDIFSSRPYFLTTIRPEHMFGTLWRQMLPGRIPEPSFPWKNSLPSLKVAAERFL